MAAPGQIKLGIRWRNSKEKGESEGCEYYGKPLSEEQETN